MLGRPILVRLIELLKDYDLRPLVVVSPAGRSDIEECLAANGLTAELVVQPRPSGMGDAILSSRTALDCEGVDQVLLVWGDIPLLQRQTLAALYQRHFREQNDFTFATRRVEDAYTVVERDEDHRVRGIVETRERNGTPAVGERDIGLFLFRAAPVLAILEARPTGAIGTVTGEHGFLYVVRHLVEQGFRVEGLPIATELDLVSLNRLSDLSVLDDLRPGNSGARH